VLTGVPHYPMWRARAPKEYKRALWSEEHDGPIKLLRARHYVPSTQSALRRGLYEATFLLTGAARLRMQRPDAILGVVPSLSGGVMARLASRLLNAPYGLLFQDLMGRAAAESGVEGAKRVASAVQEAERWSVAKASAVAVIADGFKPYVESLGVQPERIHRVRNWVHIESPGGTPAEVRRRFGLPEEAVIAMHAGNMGYKQGLENLVECAREAQSDAPNLFFVTLGDGNRRLELERLAEQHRLSNIRFLPIQPDDEFANLLGAADLLLVNQRGTVTDMSLPGKLTSYFFAGRPVVAAVAENSETAREVQGSGGGIVVPPDQPSELLRGLISLAGDRKSRESLGESARAYAELNLTPEACLESCDYFIEAIAKRPGAIAS